jgi:hypothetical protein
VLSVWGDYRISIIRLVLLVFPRLVDRWQNRSSVVDELGVWNGLRCPFLTTEDARVGGIVKEGAGV